MIRFTLSPIIRLPSLVRSQCALGLRCLVRYSGIEHDGLGRYGDPVNPEGDISAAREMWLHVRPGGMLFLAVPLAGMIIQPRSKARQTRPTR